MSSSHSLANVASGTAIGPDEAARIERQLARIVASPSFHKAERLSDFLQFVVRETLAGRGSELKEYAIALEVFGRPSSFDPRTDSAVRVTARSLRNKLSEYYERDGVEADVVIDLPKGGYEPAFRFAAAAAEAPVAPPAAPRSARMSARRLWGAAILAAVVVALGLAFAVHSVSRRSREVIVAVLAVEGSTASEDDVVFAEGLVDELTTRLAGVDGYRVMARTSSQRLRAAADPVSEARRVHVDVLIEGRVSRTAGSVRVSARLVNTADGLQVWGASYDRDARDSFMVQDEIAFNVTRALSSKLGVPTSPKPRSAANSEAVRTYWTGRFVRRQSRPDSMPRAAALFERATRLDPSYADAWAALADVEAMMAYHGASGQSVSDLVARARTAATRALELDRNSVEARCALGQVLFFFDRDPKAAEVTFREALRLNPSYYKTQARYSFLLASQGRFDDAIAQVRAAIRLDPMSMAISNDLGVLLYVAGRCDEAIAAARESLRGDARFAPAHGLIGCCHAVHGRLKEAVTEFEEAIAISDRYSYLLGHLGHEYARQGEREKALAVVSELENAPDQTSVSYVHVAYVLSGLREHDRAIAALEKAVERHDADVIYMGVDPTLDELRGQPRFVQLLARVGLKNLRPSR